MSECASRQIWIIAPGEDEPSPLHITFHVPEQMPEEDWIYVGLLSMKCMHFEKDFHLQSIDSLGVLMNMPFMTQAYLSSWQRQGYKIYWFERGDFDDPYFWGNPPSKAANPRPAGPLLRLARRLKLAPPLNSFSPLRS